MENKALLEVQYAEEVAAKKETMKARYGSNSYPLTHPLTLPLTSPLTHSLPPPLTHPLTPPLTLPLTHSRIPF